MGEACLFINIQIGISTPTDFFAHSPSYICYRKEFSCSWP